MKDDIKSYLTSINVDWEEVDDLAQVSPAARSTCPLVVHAVEPALSTYTWAAVLGGGGGGGWRIKHGLAGN